MKIVGTVIDIHKRTIVIIVYYYMLLYVIMCHYISIRHYCCLYGQLSEDTQIELSKIFSFWSLSIRDKNQYKSETKSGNSFDIHTPA